MENTRDKDFNMDHKKCRKGNALRGNLRSYKVVES